MNDWKASNASRATGLPGSILSRSFVLVILTLLFATNQASGDETPKQNLEFRWKFIKVGSMDFEIGPAFFSMAAANAGVFGQPLFAKASENLSVSEGGGAPVHLAVTGITSGPLKWVKNYQARAELLISAQSRTFVLAGQDNGVYEKRALVFAEDSPPAVESFIDSTATEPLEVQNAWKHDTVDPLTVFEWMIFAAAKGQSCVKKFWIYDAKRRYAARTTDLASKDASRAEENDGIGIEQNGVKRCRLTLLGSKAKAQLGVKVANYGNDLLGSGVDLAKNKSREDGPNFGDKGTTGAKLGWGSLWPFGTEDRHIDFEFSVCASEQIIVERVVMGVPFGKVIGTTKARC